jgi:hypothetical protein
MSEVFPKFIIEGDSLIISKVKYHKDIVTDRSQVKGGGWFRWANEHKTLVFYGQSEDFGPVKLEDIRECVRNGKVYSNIYKTHTLAERHSFGYDSGSEIIPLPVEKIPANE